MSTPQHRRGRLVAVAAIATGLGLGTVAVASAATPRSPKTVVEPRERVSSTDPAASRLERERVSQLATERADILKVAATLDGRLDR